MLFRNSDLKILSKIDKEIGSVSFVILNDGHIDISCMIPCMDKIEVEDIPNLAEKYANLLTSIVLGEYNEVIYQDIQSLKLNTQSNKELLFLNNLLAFWSILYKEKHQHNVAKYSSKNYPLIRPSQVFKL